MLGTGNNKQSSAYDINPEQNSFIVNELYVAASFEERYTLS